MGRAIFTRTNKLGAFHLANMNGEEIDHTWNGDTTLRLQFFYKFYDRNRLVFTFQSFNTNVNELQSYSTQGKPFTG